MAKLISSDTISSLIEYVTFLIKIYFCGGLIWKFSIFIVEMGNCKQIEIKEKTKAKKLKKFRVGEFYFLFL